jgi:hypothetical protein
VRIGVVTLHPSFIISLPGPHQEVKAGIEVIVEGLKKGSNKEEIARSLSNRYRQLLRNIHRSETET